MILAEEAEVDFNSVSVEQAETRPDLYAHMGTGGSGSTMENFTPLRRAGATVRELMITAAAHEVECAARRSASRRREAVVHEKSVAQGQLRRTGGSREEVAACLIRKKCTLKDESKFEVIGHPMPRVDIPSKVNGSAQFGLDVRVPEMLFAVVARCPTFGGKAAQFDAAKAKAVAGSARCVRNSRARERTSSPPAESSSSPIPPGPR